MLTALPLPCDVMLTLTLTAFYHVSTQVVPWRIVVSQVGQYFTISRTCYRIPLGYLYGLGLYGHGMLYKITSYDKML